jgi:uncharacterized membrane protein (DUF4010 family)
MNLADSIIAVVVAALAGAVIGVERQRSGHATGPEARFGGIRTFSLLGGVAGAAGLLWSQGGAALAVVLLAGCAAIIVAGYVGAMRRDIDATTEVSAFVVLAAGVLAGSGHLALASGIAAATALLLVEKSRLHDLVRRIEDDDLRVAFRFAVMAIVVLPLLPEGPFGPLGGIRPRQLWVLVLFFSGLSFAGYIARRSIGEAHGYTVAGLLGGLISSTSVTLTYARASRDAVASDLPLAAGVLGACTILVPRVLAAVAVLAPQILGLVGFYLAGPLAVGLLGTLAGLGRSRRVDTTSKAPGNPLQLTAALQMAVLFQLVLFAVAWAGQVWGETGLIASGAILGLTDVDALTISMARAAERGEVYAAAQAIAVGVLSNTLLKLVLVVLIGRGTFRRAAATGLFLMSVASAAALMVGR